MAPRQRLRPSSVDDDEIEDSQPRRSKQKSKRSRDEQRQRDEEEDRVDPEDEEAEDADVIAQREAAELIQHFVDQPIPPGDAMKLRGIPAEWSSLLNTLDKVFPHMNTAASDLVEQHGNEDNEHVNLLDETMRDLLDARTEIRANSRALEDLKTSIERDQHEGDIVNAYEKGAKKIINAYRDQTARQKYAKDPLYISFREEIWEAAHPGQGMGPLTQTIPKENNDESDSDEDFEIGGATKDYKDPLTLLLLDNPYTSKKCNHSFSKDAIFAYIGYGSKECPSTGCHAMLTRADLVEDKQLAQKVAAYTRRMKEKERGEREEEEIIDSD